jgi:Sec-independent protein secretion pathway component TatC
MTVNRLLLVAALVLFVLGAVLAFGVVGSASLAQVLGLACAGLACWVASLLV